MLRRTQTVRRTVEDLYLRDDIGCGSALCVSCVDTRFGTDNGIHPPPLRADASHYAIPDARALVEFADAFLAAAVPNAADVVLLTSELGKALLVGDPRVVRSLRKFTTDPLTSRGVKHFPNDFCRATSTAVSVHRRLAKKSSAILGRTPQMSFASLPKNAEEVATQTHCVLRAAGWYASHVVRGAFPVVVVTDDPTTLSFQKESLPRGVEVWTPSAYFPKFRPNSLPLAEFERARDARVDAEAAAMAAMDATKDSNATSPANRKFAFPPHWSRRDVAEGLRVGTLVTGTLRIVTDATARAVVATSSTSVSSSGVARTGRATDGSSLKPADSNQSTNTGNAEGETHETDDVRDADRNAEDDVAENENSDDGSTAWRGGDVFIASRLLRNRAMDGDQVAVLLFPTARWCKKSAVHRRRDSDDGDEDEDDDGAKDDDADADDETVPTGEIVAITRANCVDLVAVVSSVDADELLGSLSSTRVANRNHVIAVPSDRAAPRIRLFTHRAGELVGKRLLVRIDGWRRESGFPDGRVVRVLGDVNDPATETAALLLQHGINDAPFSNGATAGLPTEGHLWVVPPGELKNANRIDARAWRTMSIDPPGCVDVDDAVSVRKVPLVSLGGGRVNAVGTTSSADPSTGATPKSAYEIGVHIADVSYFVSENSVLDLEARARGTTTYLTDRRIDMLPELLSANLASLLQGKDRLAMSCVFTVDCETLKPIKPPRFGRSVINNKHQLSYYAAQAICDREGLEGTVHDLAKHNITSLSPTEVKGIASDLRVLVRFSDTLCNARLENGAIELSSAELQFETSADMRDDDDDDENAANSSQSFSRKKEVPMMSVVAELMIAANSAVATKIINAQKKGGPPALLRKHDPPLPEKFAELSVLLMENSGVLLDASSGKALSNSLTAAEHKSADPNAGQMFRSLATRAMCEAQYVNAFDAGYESQGDARKSSTKTFSHYGLALDLYAHFTSPIRRYADLVVHRQLWDALCVCGEVVGDFTEVKPQNSNAVAKLAEHLNRKTRAAKIAQRRSVDLKVTQTLRNRPGVVFEAYVRSVTRTRVSLFIPAMHVHVFVDVLTSNGHAVFPKGNSYFDKGKNDSPSTEASGATTKIAYENGFKVLTFVDKNSKLALPNAPRIKTGTKAFVELSVRGGDTGRAARLDAVLLERETGSFSLEQEKASGLETRSGDGKKSHEKKRSVTKITQSVAGLTLIETRLAHADAGDTELTEVNALKETANANKKTHSVDTRIGRIRFHSSKHAATRVFPGASFRDPGDTAKESLVSSEVCVDLMRRVRPLQQGDEPSGLSQVVRSRFVQARAAAATAAAVSAATRNGALDENDPERRLRRKRRAAVAGLLAEEARRLMLATTTEEFRGDE